LVSNNIGQIAYLNAQAHGIQRIYFSGFFIRGHPVTMNTLSYAISFWSKGKIKALFLRHEGYLGAMGAFLRDEKSTAKQGSFKENFSLSRKISGKSLVAVGALESSPSDLLWFPLIEGDYNPDTFTLDDAESQAYWIDLLDLNLALLVKMALAGENGSSPEERKQRVDSFASMYRHHLKLLKKEPKAYGVLSVRR
jgi:bifunctional damage-control phosphatase, subfamily II, fusion protein